jgi:hypothetical protein
MDSVINITVSFVAAILGYSLDNPESSIPAFIFLCLAAYWRQTGRFPVVGFLVRLLYLPINLLASVLFVVGKVINAFLDLLDMFAPLKGLTFLLLIIMGLENGYYFLLAGVLALLLRFGLETEPLRYTASYYPRAKRRPQPKPKAAKPAPKAVPPRNKPEPMPAAPPIVQVAAPALGSSHPFSQLVNELPPHLQALVGGAVPEPEAEAAERRKVPLVKLVLRSLLLLPFWLLFLFIKPVKAVFGKQKQPEPEKEPRPLSSEASSHE